MPLSPNPNPGRRPPGPMEAGPSNWVEYPPDYHLSPVPDPGSPSPSLSESFPVTPATDSGYFPDSSSNADFDFAGNNGDSSDAESEVVQPLLAAIPPADGVLAVDTSPVYSPASVDSSSTRLQPSLPESVSAAFAVSNSVCHGRSKDKRKAPMKMRLSRRGDRVWKWMKTLCPVKRKALSAPPSFSRKIRSPASFVLPLKKRLCRGISETDAVLAPSFVTGVVAHPDGPPAYP